MAVAMRTRADVCGWTRCGTRRRDDDDDDDDDDGDAGAV